ncbi:MAG: cell division protein FtsQ/DivIB [Nocardioidaceae bacterium]
MTRGSADRFARRRRSARLGRLRWVWAGLAVVAVAAGLAWVVLFSTWLGVRGIAVSGEQTVAAREIRDATAVADGTPLVRVDAGAVERRIEQIPRIESATVHRSWPQTLRIEIRERTAIAVVNDDGEKQALDRHGVLFKHVKKVPKRLPEVTVTADGAGREDALREVAAVVDALDHSIAHKVERVQVASMDAIVLVLRNGDEVRWGSAEDSGRKAQVLRTLLKLPADTYDVTAPERPTTKS